MANKIQQRRGLKSAIPTLSSGELGYTTDTRELFIGTGSGNVNVGGSHWYRGTAMSGTSTVTNIYSYSACPQVKLDDIYLNTSNGNVYACTIAGSGSSAKWTYQGSIKGATGATGATGDAGQDLQAVYSTTPTQVGTWIDGSPIYRIAWSCTVAEANGDIIYTISDIANCPVSNLAAVSRGAVREYYNIAEYNNASESISCGSLSELNSALSKSTGTFTIYCVVEYIAQ